jgi:subtilisin family serine protease
VWVDDQRVDTYDYMQGTSMAAPHVSGAAAVLRAAGLSPQETVDRLLATAKDLGAEGPDSTYGSGRLDVARAVEGLGTPSTAPPAATPSPPPDTTPPAPPASTPPPPPGPADRSDGTPTSAAPAPSTTAAPTAEPTTTTARRDDENRVAIQTETPGGGGARPWVPIAFATFAVGGTAAAVFARRNLRQ